MRKYLGIVNKKREKEKLLDVTTIMIKLTATVATCSGLPGFPCFVILQLLEGNPIFEIIK